MWDELEDEDLGDDVSDFVGLTGRKRSGKNTAALAYEAAGYTQMAFATPIKIMVIALLSYQGVDDETIGRMMDGDLKEVPTPFLAGRSPRHAMQTLGTEWGRKLMGEDIWIDMLVNASDQFEMVVVTDVRFPNEVEALRKRCHAEIVRITRPGLPAGDGHASEAHIDTLEVDQDIVNDASSAEEFANTVARLLVDPGESEGVH